MAAGGERVIQPINDPTASDNSAEMQRKMDELLGNVPVEQSRPTQTEVSAPVTDPNVVQPGYMQNLASDLNRDMQTPAAPAEPDSMAARMSADLKNDPLTQQAQAMPAAPAAPAPEAPAAPEAPVDNAQAQ
jgi:hypothetical protein